MFKRVPLTGGEKESLQVAMDRHREAILWKLEGLDDEQLRRPMTPSGRACWDWSSIWRRSSTAGSATRSAGRPSRCRSTTTTPMPTSGSSPTRRPTDILAFYARARAAADQVIADVDLEDTGTAWFGEPVSMRWVLIHMLEETARHAGHIDILRELIDGVTGDHNRS